MKETQASQTDQVNQEFIDSLRKQEEDNHKYFIATLGVMITYSQVKGDNSQLDQFLLGMAKTFTDCIDTQDKKLSPDKFNSLLQAINSGENSKEILDTLTNEFNDYLLDLKNSL